MASQIRTTRGSKESNVSPAEFRGPGVRHSFDQDSPDEYDLDIHRHRNFSSRNGRLILLGDGTEVLTDSTTEDADMFDHSMDDDKDIEEQIKTGSSSSTTTNDENSSRSDRESTPGPQSAPDESKSQSSEAMKDVSHGPTTTIQGVADKPTEK